MATVELLVAALVVVVLVSTAADRVNVPYPVALVVGGLGLGLIPGLPAPGLPPDLVFVVFLPPLLYSAALLTSPLALRDSAAQISLLAVGLVLVTVPAVAAIAHLAAGLPWAAAFVLGAVLGPTDPIAATTVIHRLHAPERLAAILEGEALVNDGTGLVAFRIAVGAAGAAGFSLGHAVGTFFLVAFGGVAIGLAVGWLATVVRRRLQNPEIEIVVAIATAYGAYVAAERVGVSGVLATVAAALVVRRRAQDISDAPTRLRSGAFWEAITFVLNAVLFLLVGLQLPSVAGGLAGESLGHLVLAAVAVIAAVLIVRFAWMFAVVRQVPVEDEEGRRRPLPAAELTALGWTGIRGALSLAAALAIPVTVSGHAFPGRPIVIFLTFATVVFTLVAPGLTLPWVLQRLGLASGADEELELDVERKLAHAALERLEEIAAAGDADEDAVDAVRSRYERELDRLRTPDGDGDAPDRQEVARLQREAIAAQRRRVRELRARREIPGELMSTVLHRLDLESSRRSQRAGA